MEGATLRYFCELVSHVILWQAMGVKMKDAGYENIMIMYEETFHGFTLEEHFHNCFEMIYIVDGSAQFIINEKLYEAKKNDIVFISNLETHKINMVSFPYKRYYILIHPKYLSSLIGDSVIASIFKHRPDDFSHIIKLNNSCSGDIDNIIRNIYEESKTKSDMWETAVKSYFCLLFTLLYRNFKEYFPVKQTDRMSDTILNIQKYIEDRCTEDLTLDTVSKKFYIDRFYLSRLFKKITGYTFKEYVIRQRIAKAKELLYYTEKSITEIGISSGFNNVNNFIRTFKNYEGIPPYQYRKKSGRKFLK